MKKVLPIITVLALSLGAANFAQANEEGHCPGKLYYKLKVLKAKVFKKILKDNGVSDETATNILNDMKELKMKIKHKIKHVLKERLSGDND